MNDKKNPFGNFSFEDMIQQVQDNPMMKAWTDSDFYKSMTGQGASHFDFESIWEAQKKNLAHLNAMNAKLGDNIKELAEKQAGMMSEAWESVKDYSQNAMDSGEHDVEANMQKAQSVFQKATANIQDLSKRGMEMTEEGAKELQERMSESVKDLQDLVEKYRK